MVIPKEHGAWFMLLLSLFIGAGTARNFGIPFFLLALSTLALFSSLYSLGEGTKKASLSVQVSKEAFSALVYFLIALFLLATLFFIYGRWSLLYLGLLAAPFFCLYIILLLKRKHRTIWGELLNIAGLSFPAAASYYVATGAWQGKGLLLWLLTFLYAGSSVFYVRLKVRQKPPLLASTGQRLAMGRGLLTYLIILFATLLIFTLVDLTPPFLLLAYLPLALKSLYAVFYSRGTPSIKRVGFLEVGYTALFATLFLIAFHI